MKNFLTVIAFLAVVCVGVWFMRSMTDASSVGTLPISPQKESGLPNTVKVNLPAKGEYASIDTNPIKVAMLKLEHTSGHENDALVLDIEQNSANYAPPVFLCLAKLLYKQGNLPDAIFWFNAGRLRGNFDAIRCADVSARDASPLLVQQIIPIDLRKAQFNDLDQYASIIDKVLKWDEATPYHYEYRWINLHGLNATQSGLGDKQTQALPLSVPESTWTTLAQKNRDDYRAASEKMVAQVKQQRLATPPSH